MVPLLLAISGHLPLNAAFAALTAQNIAIVDARGDYRFRLGLLLGMSAVFVGSAALGTAAAHNLPAAIAGTVLICLCASVWRHLSSDYGAGLAITSSFVFFFALSSAPDAHVIANHCLATLAGAAWGIVIQVAMWPFHPQHPLRRSVADAWVAVAELFDAMRDSPATDVALRHQQLAERETAVREALDHATTALGAARLTPVRTDLEAMSFAAARFAMRVSALDTALQLLADDPQRPWLRPAFEPLRANLANLARSIAVTIVSHQPAHLGTAEVRLRRTAALLRALRLRLTHVGGDAATPQLDELLDHIETHLPEIQRALRATSRRANERGAFSLELLDLRAVALRPLASALNLTWKVDPALIRFTLRSAVLTVAGVIAFKWLKLPHGYWLPFTAVVVLQPDYGSTRRRAAQRMLGTVAGAVLASLLLWLRLPMLVLMIANAVTIFIFGYWIKRNYGVAVVFITIFVVLLTEATGPVTISLAVERVGCTLAGGLVALIAAQLFWPMWERDRLPPIVAAALRRNAGYLGVLLARIASGEAFDHGAREAKRRVERANAAVFSSLNRLNADPKNQREGLEHVATIANGNQRITRALNVVALHLTEEAPWPEVGLRRFRELASRAFAAIADAVELSSASAELNRILEDLESNPLPSLETAAAAHRWVFVQLTQVTTELCALIVAVADVPPR